MRFEKLVLPALLSAASRRLRLSAGCQKGRRRRRPDHRGPDVRQQHDELSDRTAHERSDPQGTGAEYALQVTSETRVTSCFGEKCWTTAPALPFSMRGTSFAVCGRSGVEGRRDGDAHRQGLFQNDSMVLPGTFQLSQNAGDFVPEDPAALERLATRFASSVVAISGAPVVHEVQRIPAVPPKTNPNVVVFVCEDDFLVEESRSVWAEILRAQLGFRKTSREGIRRNRSGQAHG